MKELDLTKQEKLRAELSAELEALVSEEIELAHAAGHEHITKTDVINLALLTYLGSLTKMPDHLRLPLYMPLELL